MSLRATIWTLCLMTFVIMALVVQTFPTETPALAISAQTAEDLFSGLSEQSQGVESGMGEMAFWGRYVAIWGDRS